MSKIFRWIRGDNRKLAMVVVIVFFTGWFSFAYYLYTNQILVMAIEGPIDNFTDTRNILLQARMDGNVKAVIIYFNTPGGYVYPCLEIAAYIAELKKIKPVIGVMGDICASGGYYIASFASHIFTHKNTLTGGIGVISVWVDRSKQHEMEGVNITVWKTSPEKDIGADWRGPTKEEYDEINATVYSIFQILIEDIQENRNLSQDNLEQVKMGTTFMGDDAVNLGLADEVGDIINALEEVIRRTGMFKFIIISPYLDERQKFFRALF